MKTANEAKKITYLVSCTDAKPLINDSAPPDSELPSDYLKTEEKKADHILLTLSHELRTPMHAILGWIEVLEEESFDIEDRQMAIKSLSRNATILLEQIDNLLDASRLMTAECHLDLGPINLHTMIMDIIHSFKPSFEAKEITFQYVNPAKGAFVKADMQYLRKVLSHLLSNAVKFTPHLGAILLHLKVIDNQMEIQIIDTGYGFNSSFLNKIKSRFQQEDGGMTRRFDGSGLGLYIADQATKRMGGRFSIESPGRELGTTCKLLFPLTVPEIF